MHAFFQAAAVFMYLFAGLLIIGIIQKRLQFKTIAMLIVILALAAGSGYLGLKTNQKDVKKDIVKAASVAEAGDVGKALELLKNKNQTALKNPLLILYRARLYALNANPVLARYYYGLVEEEEKNGSYKRIGSIEEDALRDEIRSAREDLNKPINSSDTALRDYLVEQNLNPADYGVELTVPQEDSPEIGFGTNEDEDSLDELILNNMKNEQAELTSKDSVLQNEADKAGLTAKIDKLVEAGVYPDGNANSDGTTTKMLLDELVEQAQELYEKDPGDSNFNLSFVNALILNEDYEGARDILIKNPTAENLAILSELVMAGKIDPSDLEKVTKSIPAASYERVKEQYEKLYGKYADKDEDEAATLIEDKLKTIENESKNPELAGLRETIDQKIDDKKEPELNLQLAKISRFFEDEDQTQAYIEETLANMEYIQNPEVVQGLNGLATLNAGNDNAFETFKDVPQQVNNLTSQILPVAIPSESNTGFNDYLSSYFTKKAVEINITRVDVSDFPDVKAYVQLGNDADVDKLLSSGVSKKDFALVDTGAELSDFDINKLKIKRSNIILCMDVSPSMETALPSLKAACVQFVRKIAGNERIGIVAFDGGIVADIPFTQDAAALESSINSFGLGNATDIHNALITSLGKLEPKDDENNIVILISDGGNNNPVPPEGMDTISNLVQKTGASIYTIGLGDEVDGNYLNNLAQRGNGRFIYSPSPNQLEAFYTFLHNQIQSQYVLSYKASNEDILERYIDLEYTDRQSKGHKEYYLPVEAGSTQEEQLAQIEELAKAGFTVKGLDKSCIIKSDLGKVDVNLIGSGFSNLQAKDVGITIENYGPLKPDQIKILDNERIQLSLPQNIGEGTYTLTVKLKDKRYSLRNELEIVKAGTVQTLEFGPYTITATNIRVTGNNVRVASGNVQINNFLRFKGDLLIEGNVDDDPYLHLTPYGQGFISFHKGQTPNFLVENVFLKYNLNLGLGQWERFFISRDDTPSEINLANKIDLGLIKVPQPKINLKPDCMEVVAGSLNLDLPMQKYLFLYAGADPMAFSGDVNMLLTSEQIAYSGEFKMSSDGSLLGKRLLNVFGLKSLEGSADTLKGDFSLKVGVGLNFWRSDENEFELSLGWKGCKFDEFLLTLPFELDVVRTPVPVTLKKMGGGLSDLSKVDAFNWDMFKKMKYVVQTDILVGKADRVMPFLSNISWLADNIPGILLLEEAKATLTFDKFALTFGCKAKLFEEFDIGECELAIGNYEFKQGLLNIGPTETIGFHVKNTVGLDLDFDKLKLKLQGGLGLDINGQGMFAQEFGVASAEVDLMGFKKSFAYDGEALIAVHKNTSGQTQLTIGLRGRDTQNGTYSDFRFYVGERKVGIVGVDIPFTEKNTLEFSW